MKMLILGVNGMLGHKVLEVALRANFQVIATTRNPPAVNPVSFQHLSFDATNADFSNLRNLNLGPGDYVVNCIGIIKSRLTAKISTLEALEVNARFPLNLAILAEEQGFRVLQIATDCVFAGDKGSYIERDPHDSHDVYGKTKSLGEPDSSQVFNIRSSIVGPELFGKSSLLEWFLSQSPYSTVSGYTNHYWNGVTTEVFSKLVVGIATASSELSGTQHFVPRDAVSKFDLLSLFRETHSREDLKLKPTETETKIDRSLSTSNPDLNEQLWKLAGFSQIPPISDFI